MLPFHPWLIRYGLISPLSVCEWLSELIGQFIPMKILLWDHKHRIMTSQRKSSRIRWVGSNNTLLVYPIHSSTGYSSDEPRSKPHNNHTWEAAAQRKTIQNWLKHWGPAESLRFCGIALPPISGTLLFLLALSIHFQFKSSHKWMWLGLLLWHFLWLSI